MHIVNPVKAPPSSDLNVAQPVTFETIRRAKRFSEERLDITLVSVQYEEDLNVVPEYFIKASNLKRSFRDIASNSGDAKKLPLVRDILQAGFDHSEPNSYLIYSNVDIAVQPYFYDFVYSQIKKGHDAFVVNRRTISSKLTEIADIAEMYSCHGEPHPGYDCFIFKRELFHEMILGNICIGIQYIGLALYVNLKLKAKKFHEFDQVQATFHIGNDKSWKESPGMYEEHNKKEFDKIVSILRTQYHKDVDIVINSAFPSAKLSHKEEHVSIGSKSIIKRLLKKMKKDVR